MGKVSVKQAGLFALNYEIRIAFRYLFAKRSEGGLSAVAWYSLIGVTLSVATLIVIQAVMIGFRVEFVSKILGANSHLSVYSDSFIKEKRQLEESNKLLNENLTQINTHNESLKVQVEKDSQTLINKQNEINMLQEEVSKLKATITDIESTKNKSIAEKKADSEMELMETKEKLMEYEVENKTLIGQTEILELQVKDANTDNENLNSIKKSDNISPGSTSALLESNDLFNDYTKKCFTDILVNILIIFIL